MIIFTVNFFSVFLRQFFGGQLVVQSISKQNQWKWIAVTYLIDQKSPVQIVVKILLIVVQILNSKFSGQQIYPVPWLPTNYGTSNRASTWMGCLALHKLVGQSVPQIFLTHNYPNKPNCNGLGNPKEYNIILNSYFKQWYTYNDKSTLSNPL